MEVGEHFAVNWAGRRSGRCAAERIGATMPCVQDEPFDEADARACALAVAPTDVRGGAAENKRICDAHEKAHESIERSFGDALTWDRLDAERACRIEYGLSAGGYRSPASDWKAAHADMGDAMSRFEEAILPAIRELDIRTSASAHPRLLGISEDWAA